VTVDKQKLYDLSFTEEAQYRLTSDYPVYETLVSGAHVGTKDQVVYNDDEYASPPMSLGFLTGAEYGVGFVVKDYPSVGWDEFSLSYLVKSKGTPPSTLSCWVSFDYGPGIISEFGEKDFLTGVGLWYVSAGWENGEGSFQSMRGSVPWDWGAWHKVDVVFSRSLNSFSLSLDGDLLYSGRFYPKSGSVFVIEMHKN
jgi:hypothetical protein